MHSVIPDFQMKQTSNQKIKMSICEKMRLDYGANGVKI